MGVLFNEELTGTRVSGIPSTAATKIQTTSPILEDIIYLMNCLVLLYMALPSATACQKHNKDKYCKRKQHSNAYNLQ